MRSEICFTILYFRSLEEKKISIPRDDFSFIKKSKFSFLLYKILTLSEKYTKVDRLLIRQSRNRRREENNCDEK